MLYFLYIDVLKMFDIILYAKGVIQIILRLFNYNTNAKCSIIKNVLIKVLVIKTIILHAINTFVNFK